MKKNLILAMALLLSFNIFAGKHRGNHHGGKHHSTQIARHAVDDLYDYVTALDKGKRDSLVKYFASYYDDAKTFSPTKSVRKRSRTELDTKIKTQLSGSQFKEYEVFMKDQHKKACMMKKKMKHGKHGHHKFNESDDSSISGHRDGMRDREHRTNDRPVKGDDTKAPEERD